MQRSSGPRGMNTPGGARATGGIARRALDLATQDGEFLTFRSSKSISPRWEGCTGSDRGQCDPEDSQVEVQLGAMVQFLLLDMVEDPVERVLPLGAIRQPTGHHPRKLRSRTVE